MATIHDLLSLTNDELIFVDKMFVAHKREIKKFAIVSSGIRSHIIRLNERNALGVSDIIAAGLWSDYTKKYIEFAYIGTPKDFLAELKAIKQSKSRKIEQNLYDYLVGSAKIMLDCTKMGLDPDYADDKIMIDLLEGWRNIKSVADVEQYMFNLGKLNWCYYPEYFLSNVSFRPNFTDEVVKKVITRIKMEGIVEK